MIEYKKAALTPQEPLALNSGETEFRGQLRSQTEFGNERKVPLWFRSKRSLIQVEHPEVLDITSNPILPDFFLRLAERKLA